MRFDTVLNNFAGSAVTTGKVQVLGDGQPWRPVVHVEDVASAFVTALEAPVERIHNQVFNVGSAWSNWEIGALARQVVDLVPGASVEVLSREDADRRSYRTSFDKIWRELPAFAPRWTVEAGIRRLVEELRGLKREDFEDPRFTRLAWLQYQLDRVRLDRNLRPANHLPPLALRRGESAA
jgi:nucleoside-diphosphate-sugar epimerase